MQIRARGADALEFEQAVAKAHEDEFGPAPTTMPIQTILYDARPT